MIPIARDTGAIVAFGGRALEEGQVPKYLNSPETPIYTKGRTLYGLDVTRAAVRKVVDMGVADPDRMVAYGWSYGGYMTFAALVQFPERFRGGVSFVGVSNWVTALEGASPAVLKRRTGKAAFTFPSASMCRVSRNSMRAGRL